MKNISFRDLRLCSKFAGMNEIEMLSLENDAAMAEVLAEIGFDTEYGVSYVPNIHRDMQSNVGLGFSAVGEINMNKSYIDSPMCTLTERMIAAAYTDPSMTRELTSLLGMRVNFRALLEVDPAGNWDTLPEDMLEPDREEMTAKILALEELRDSIRGPLYNDRGCPKTFAEYRMP